MLNKKMSWILGVGIIAFGVILSTIFSSQKQPMRMRPQSGGIKNLKVVSVNYVDIPSKISMSGPLYAYNKAELYAEVSGVLLDTPKRFKEGHEYAKGEVLLAIDDRVYKNNVLAQKSGLLNQLTLLLPDLKLDFPVSAGRWENYLKQFDLNKTIAPFPDPGSDQERYYIASRNLYNQFYIVKGMEETLAKYTLKAPYQGIVTMAGINPGTLVRQGQKLGEFTSTDFFEMEASVGAREVGRLWKGQEVILNSEIIPGDFSGSIQRINSVIDRSSMTVKVYIHTHDQKLTDGMYLTAHADARPIQNVFEISRDLLLKDNHIFTVQDSVLVSKKVVIVAEEGDKVFIRGLPAGTHILNEVWSEAVEGIKLPSADRQTIMPSDSAKRNQDGGRGKS